MSMDEPNGMTYDGGFAGGYNSGHWDKGNDGWDNKDSRVADERVAKTLILLVGLILAVVALPVLIIAAIFYYVMFRILHYRPRFQALVATILSIIGVIAGMSVGWFNPVIYTIRNLHINSFNDFTQHFGTIAGSFMLSMTIVGLIVGSWAGFTTAWLMLQRLRKSPYLINEDPIFKWQYHYSFRESPISKRKTANIIKQIKADTLVPYNNPSFIPLGIEEKPIDHNYDPVTVVPNRVISRSDDEIVKHTMVTGTSGSGKTVTLKSMMTRDIKKHRTIFVIDCKKDPEFAEFLSRQAKQSDCNFYHFSADLPYRIQGNPAGPSSYDPLANGTVGKKTDMMLNTREWTAEADVYRGQAQAYLSKIFAIIDVAKQYDVFSRVKGFEADKGDMWTFTQMLNPNTFNSVVSVLNTIPDASFILQQARELAERMTPAAARTQEGKAMQTAASEYLGKMTGLMSTNYGRWLKGGEGAGSGRIIDLGQLSASKGNIVLFSLDAAQKNDNGSLIGSMICTDISNIAETRKNLGQNNQIVVYIDEFQSLPPECVKSMLQKARSANVGLVLAFQSLDQVSATYGNDTYIKSLLDTCSNFIFHAGSNYDTGLMAAKIIGTRDEIRVTTAKRHEGKWFHLNWGNNRDLQTSSTTVQAWILEPSELAKLSMPTSENDYKTEAIIIKKASSDPIDKGIIGAVAHKVRMIPPDCVLKEYFSPNNPVIDIHIKENNNSTQNTNNSLQNVNNYDISIQNANITPNISQTVSLNAENSLFEQMPEAESQRIVQQQDQKAWEEYYHMKAMKREQTVRRVAENRREMAEQAAWQEQQRAESSPSVQEQQAIEEQWEPNNTIPTSLQPAQNTNNSRTNGRRFHKPTRNTNNNNNNNTEQPFNGLSLSDL